MFRRSLVILLALYGILVADQVAANTPTTSASESQVVVFYFHRNDTLPRVDDRITYNRFWP